MQARKSEMTARHWAIRFYGFRIREYDDEFSKFSNELENIQSKNNGTCP